MEAEERVTKKRKFDSSEDMNEVSTIGAAVIEEQNQLGQSTEQPSEGEADGSPQLDIQNENKPPPGMSKSQWKKVRKQQLWEAGKDYRKAKRREKHKEKQARKADERARKQVNVASFPENAPEMTSGNNPKEPRKGHARPLQVPLTLVVDCEFEDYMSDKELVSLGAQLTRCYSENRSAVYRTHMVVSSWEGKLKTRFETVLTNHHRSWNGVIFTDKNFVEAAEQLNETMTRWRPSKGGKSAGALMEMSVDSQNTGSSPEVRSLKQQTPLADRESTLTEAESSQSHPSIVYLTSDSPHSLDRLSPNTSYIIGGIVDKNRHKGICYKRASERGIQTAKLPIGDYMTMQSRTVLTVNQVMEIMLKWLETGDWGEAFMRVIPKRKDAKLKAQGESSADDRKNDLIEEEAVESGRQENAGNDGDSNTVPGEGKDIREHGIRVECNARLPDPAPVQIEEVGGESKGCTNENSEPRSQGLVEAETSKTG